jgi:CubicO group peptidase (beta-lactamase class C family)
VSDAIAVKFDEKKVDTIFAALDQCHLPGAAVGVAIGGRPVYRKGFGLANMEMPVVLSPTVRMRIASTTKHFTCLAYLLLCEEGRAALDDPIGKFLPEIHQVARAVTAGQLMGHVGGLRDAKDVVMLFNGNGKPVSSNDLLAVYREIDDVNFPPGTFWSYNNGGYLLLTFAIERITGRSFEDVLRERIFEPVGMFGTMVRRWDTDFVPNSAALHMTKTNPDNVGTTHGCVSTGGVYEKSYTNVATAGEGGIVTTVDDMLRWLAHMENPRVGNASTWRAMRTPQRLVNGVSTGYGLGLKVASYRGVETLFHAGGTLGGNSQMIKVPAAGVDVVVLVNRHDVSAAVLAAKVLAACLEGLDPVQSVIGPPPARGVFRSPSTGRVVSLFGQDGQQIAVIDGQEIPLAADGNAELAPDGWFGFKEKETLALIGDPVEPRAIRVVDFGNADELQRVKSVAEPDIGAIIGSFRSDSTDTDATIFATRAGLKLRTVGWFGSAVHSLEYLAEGIWRSRQMSSMSYSSVMSFSMDGGTFHLTTSRTRGLEFRRSG